MKRIAIFIAAGMLVCLVTSAFAKAEEMDTELHPTTVRHIRFRKPQYHHAITEDTLAKHVRRQLTHLATRTIHKVAVAHNQGKPDRFAAMAGM